MNPVSYQSMASSVNGGYQNLGLDRMLTTSSVMYCEKCGFPSTDPAAFKKHMMEHMGTRFYCLYCNHVAYSEAELNIHQKQHGTIYPFKCHHCGQGYMRRLCLVKHIERLHSKDAAQGPGKADMVKLTHAPVSRASPSGEPPPVRPLVRVTVPTPSTPITIPGKVEQRGKPLDSTVSITTKGDKEHASSLNGLIQHNRALTVSLPEEVSIPAGCLVELVEVKTVNGSKELKLRLVSQQENESATKDTRTTVLQNTSPGKPLSSNFSNPNSMRSASMGMCTVNRKQCETKTVNLDHPSHPVSIPKIFSIQSAKEKCSLKRTSPEISNTVIPVKISKTIPNPVREGNGGIKFPQREFINPKAAHSTVFPSRIANRLTSNMHPEKMATSGPQRVADERKNFIPEPPKSIQPRRASDPTSNPRDVTKAIKVEPGQVRLKGNKALEMRKDVVCLNQQSLKPPAGSLGVPLAASSQGRPSALLARKERSNTASPSFQIPGTVRRTLNEPSSVTQPAVKNVTSVAGVKMASWSQAAQSSERAAEADKREPESFPVISSVFSLSQHPEDVQSSIKPLVIALRGIVMNKNNCSDNTTLCNTDTASSSKDYAKERPTSRCSALAVMKAFQSTNQSLMKQTDESVKREDGDKTTWDTPTQIKSLVSVKQEEQTATLVAGNKGSQNLALNTTSLTYQETVSEAISADAARPICLTDKYDEHDASSRFMTVSLKKVQVGVWKKCKKRLKLKITNCKTQTPIGGLNDCAVYHPMPLKVDQLVKRPSQYQPVVVLNHPKPRAPLSGVSAANVGVTGTSEVVPKCQILKMRLSKVMGQKYEVMGCTVRVLT